MTYDMKVYLFGLVVALVSLAITFHLLAIGAI